MTRAVLFDFDLTLADSSAAIVDCASCAFDSMGLPRPTPAEIRRTIGLTLPKAFVALAGAERAHRAEAFVRAFHDRADQVMVALTTMLPHAAETARTLKSRGMLLGIVSTKLRDRITAILQRQGLDAVFDVIIGGDDVATHKPSPEGLQRALAELGVEPHEALFVGDHPVDAQAAQRAGTEFVAVLTGAAIRDEFAGHSVRQFLFSMEPLATILANPTTAAGA